MSLRSTRPSPTGLRLALPALLAGTLLSGCISTDLLRNAERQFSRGVKSENTAAFYGPILAKVRNDGAVPPIPPEARTHYLGVIANMELVGPIGKQELKRDGQLGDAFSLRLLAEWRLGRMTEARASLRELRDSGQESLDQRVRALVAAFAGIIRIEDALAARASGESFQTIYNHLAGPTGAWRALGSARMETARAGATPPELLETRLAAFKVLKDAYDATFSTPPSDEKIALNWKRARAEAQIELAEFATLPAADSAAHTRKVRQWQQLCGLDPVVP